MSLEFCINEFEGPLDLLLHLVKSAKMDIYEINTTEIINQYLKFIHSMEDANIDVASEYLVMASELVHLKSRLLVNNDEISDEEENEFAINSEEDLKNKLIEYEKYKTVTDNFRDLEEKRQTVFTKLPESTDVYNDNKINVNHNLSIDDLLNAFLEFKARQMHDKPLKTRITKKEESIEERKESIRTVLNKKRKINFLDLFEEFTKEYVVITLLSILDMSKDDEINITQKRNFSPIMIEAK